MKFQLPFVSRDDDLEELMEQIELESEDKIETAEEVIKKGKKEEEKTKEKIKNLVKPYENDYPIQTVIITLFFTLIIYVFGTIILLPFGTTIVLLYLMYCFFIELNTMKRSCLHCYYYGKLCAYGRGKLCSFIFREERHPLALIKRKCSFFSFIPNILVLLLPIIGGLILLFYIGYFDWLLVILMLFLFVFFFTGNVIIRNNYACKFCLQREIGCPTEKFLNKKAHENDEDKEDIYWKVS